MPLLAQLLLDYSQLLRVLVPFMLASVAMLCIRGYAVHSPLPSLLRGYVKPQHACSVLVDGIPCRAAKPDA